MITRAINLLELLEKLVLTLPKGQTWGEHLIEYKKNKRGECISMEKLRLGLGERQDQLKALLAKREIAVRTGNPTLVIDNDLKAFGDLMFDPRLNLKLSSLEAATGLTDEGKAERDDIYKLQSVWRAGSAFANFQEELTKLIGNKKTVKVKIQKKVKAYNGDQLVDMNYLPRELKALYNLRDVTTETIPCSLLRAVGVVEKTEVTGKDILRFSFISATFDELVGNSGDIQQHYWTIVYELVEPQELTSEESSEVILEDELA